MSVIYSFDDHYFWPPCRWESHNASIAVEKRQRLIIYVDAEFSEKWKWQIENIQFLIEIIYSDRLDDCLVSWLSIVWLLSQPSE